MGGRLLAGMTVLATLFACSAVALSAPISAKPGSGALAAAPGSQSRIIDGFIVDSGPPPPADPKARYYVEFRARPLSIYGHTYVVYGRLDDTGTPAEKRFVGLHPQGDFAGLTAGSLPMLVPGTTLPVSGDADLPVLAAYRVTVTPAQYAKIQAFVYEMRNRPISWNLYTQNCNYFAGELAKRIGLKAPFQNFQFTPLYVKQLEALNQN